MKFNYYSYHIHNNKNDKRTIQPIFDLLKNFTAYNNPHYKNSFKHNGENIYLIHSTGRLFLLIQTKDNEIIKKIDSASIEVSELHEMLNRDESIGFASYVFIESNYIAFASSISSPRIKAFTDFIRSIFGTLKLWDFELILTPLQIQTSKADALKLPFIGKATIQVETQNSLGQHILSFINGSAEDFKEIDSIEVIIRPKKSKEISSAVKKLIQAVPDNNLNKMMLKAKGDIHDRLVDYYIASKGIIFDTLEKSSETSINEELIKKTGENSQLLVKVQEHVENELYSKEPIASISAYNDPAAWSGSTVSVCPTGSEPSIYNT
jgi:Intracellular sensor of Lambda phage, Abi component